MVKSAARPVIKNIGKNSVLVSKTPVGSLNPVKKQILEKYGNTNIMTRNQYGIKTTFGDTNKDAAKTIITEYGKTWGVSRVLDTSENWVETY